MTANIEKKQAATPAKTPAHWFNPQELAAVMKNEIATLVPEADTPYALIAHFAAVTRDYYRSKGRRPSVEMVQSTVSYLSRSSSLMVSLVDQDDVCWLCFPNASEGDPTEAIKKALLGHWRSLKAEISVDEGNAFIVACIRQKAASEKFKADLKIFGGSVHLIGEYKLFGDEPEDGLTRRCYVCCVKVGDDLANPLTGI